jgi:hypothetical protein
MEFQPFDDPRVNYSYGFYDAVLNAWVWDNAQHEEGVSHHVVPMLGNDEKYFDMGVFLSVLRDLNDESHIIDVGGEVVKGLGGIPIFILWMFSSESPSEVNYTEDIPNAHIRRRFEYTDQQLIELFEDFRDDYYKGMTA